MINVNSVSLPIMTRFRSIRTLHRPLHLEIDVLQAILSRLLLCALDIEVHPGINAVVTQTHR